MRLALLRGVTLAGTMLVLLTEGLSSVEQLRRTPLIAVWILILLAGVLAAWRLRREPVIDAGDTVVWVCGALCAIIATITLGVAVNSPPNSSDAMAYHLPRVIYWAEQGSVRFFPTPYLNQIMLQPFAEYVMLHSYLLTGGDYWINLVQWSASVVSIVAVSLAAAFFGAPARGQAIAALACATLPSGILASTGAKNDYVLAMWIIIAVCFAFQFARESTLTNTLFLGVSIGLALLTKGTAYVFLPWLLAAVLAVRWRPSLRSAMITFGVIAACVMALNGPQYLRNLDLSGSPMGFDSAQGNGYYRWRNEQFGWKPTISNAMRNVTEQLGARSEWWNRTVYGVAVLLHQQLGIDPEDPSTTWRGAHYGPPRNANHEADAPNRVHLLALLLLTCVFIWRVRSDGSRGELLYVAGLLCGFVAFSAYLKWQPFMARLFLPLFVCATPLFGILGKLRGIWAPFLQLVLAVFLFDVARLPLFQNWVRPIKGTNSVFTVSRERQYFADMTLWNNRQSYVDSAVEVARTRCDTIGIDATNLQLEYPLMALVRQQQPAAQFVHTGVENSSKKYAPPVSASPCVVVCLDCAGDTSRLALYSRFKQADTFGKFVVMR